MEIHLQPPNSSGLRIALVTPVLQFGAGNRTNDSFRSGLRAIPNLEYFIVDGGLTDWYVSTSFGKTKNKSPGWISEPERRNVRRDQQGLCAQAPARSWAGLVPRISPVSALCLL